MQKVRVCDYEYWIKWARLLSPMHNENARKTSSSSTGLPLKSKSVKTWETEVYTEGGLFCAMRNLLSTHRRIWLQDEQNKVESKFLKRTAPRPFIVAMAKFDSVKDVWLPTPALLIWRKIQISAEQARTMEKWQGPGPVNVWRWKSCLYIQRC